jgi:hypothetical protein
LPDNLDEKWVDRTHQYHHVKRVCFTCLWNSCQSYCMLMFCIFSRFTPIQRFMIIRAIRPDRLIQTTRSFIIQGLGRRWVSFLR